jgi:hypothetical protein
MEPKAVTVLLEFQYAKPERLPIELVAEFPIAEYVLGLPGDVAGLPILAWSYDPAATPSTRAKLAGQSIRFDPEDEIDEASVLQALEAKDSLRLAGFKVRWEVTDRTRPLVASFRVAKVNYDVEDSPELAGLQPAEWTFVLTHEQQGAAQPAYRLIAVVEPVAPHVPKNVRVFAQGLNCQNPATIKRAHQMLSCIANRLMHHP